MSRELDIRFWCEDDFGSLRSRFELMIQAFESWRGEGVQWSSVVIQHKAPGNEIRQSQDNLTAEKIIAMLPAGELDEYKVTTYGSMPCWRFSGENIYLGEVAVAISAWGNTYGEMFGFDRQFEGHGQLCLLNSKPFFGLLDLETQEFPANNSNAKIEENVEALLSLLIELTTRLKPAGWMAFTDDGSAYCIFNAHLVYFSNSRFLLNQVLAFRIMIQYGHPKQALVPVDTISSLIGTGYHQSFRTAAQDVRLLQRLKDCSQKSISPTEAHVQRVLASQKYDLMQGTDGAIVLEFPFFLNSFLDEFVLDLLEDGAV